MAKKGCFAADDADDNIFQHDYFVSYIFTALKNVSGEIRYFNEAHISFFTNTSVSQHIGSSPFSFAHSFPAENTRHIGTKMD
jgi:hypothetical protein